MVITVGNDTRTKQTFVLEMQTDEKIKEIRRQARENFADYSRHPRRTAEIEKKQDRCSEVIQACNNELDRRMKRAA